MRRDFFGLYRADDERWLAGVCGGLAAYWGLEVILLRMVWLIFTLLLPWLAGGLYFLAWFVLPIKDPATGMEAGFTLLEGGRLGRLLGGFLLLLGIYYLFDALTYGAGSRFLAELRRYLWPIFFLSLGGLLLLPPAEKKVDEDSATFKGNLVDGG